MSDAAARHPDVGELVSLACECARRAGTLLREHFSEPPRDVRTKSGPTDLVSASDLAAEDVVRELLARERPGDGVLAEERAETASRTGLRWVVDPLDGTINFLKRIPHWGVSVACEDADGSLAGVVHDPLRDEWFVAARGRGATLDGVVLGGSDATDLGVSTVGGEFSAHTLAQEERVRRLAASAGHLRSYGSATLDLAWAAAGRFDAVFHGRYPSPWDLAAGSLLCREAGLSFERVATTGDDEPLLLAAPAELARALRELIA